MHDPTRIFPISSMDDPRVAAFRDLKDRELAAMGNFFIAEGLNTSLRLMRSSYQTMAVLLSETRLPEIEPQVPPGVPVYVGSNQTLDSVIGFKFHSGLLALGCRKSTFTLDDLFTQIQACPQQPPAQATATIVVCPDISNVDNAGSIIRIAAAFGAQAMIFGETACDPFWRRSIRVSMGNVFSLPIYQSKDIRKDLLTLKHHHGYQLVGTVLDPDATPLTSFAIPQKTALLLGNEAQGIGPKERAILDTRVTIPMHHGTDSLNISIAAAVFLYELTKPPLSPSPSGRGPG
jgi:tRNA G18 (ribose-2'-O)-methylase SpoU